MPTNLPPEYFNAEKRYKDASSPAEKIAALEDLIATIPKHKGTDKLRADLRRRLSKLKEEAVKKKKGGKTDFYSVPREGAAQVALVGFANSGKSSVLAALTNAKPVIADYPMSTVLPLSGMMPFEDIQFQLVDLPPIGGESTDGWVSGVLRVADMLMVILDFTETPEVQAELLMEQISEWNIIKKTLIAANKIDAFYDENIYKRLKEKYDRTCPVIAVSAWEKRGLEELRKSVFELSDIIRVYSKEPGKEPDFGQPFILKEGSTILDLARVVHKDFLASLKFACIWGSARFPGQKVPRDYILKDRDVVELHM